MKCCVDPRHGGKRVFRNRSATSDAGSRRLPTNRNTNINITRGRLFEQFQRQVWEGPHAGTTNFEVTVQSRDGRNRRIDLLVVDDRGELTIIEFKASNWDKMEEHRIRPNLLRQINQILEYIDVYWDSDIPMNPALVYPSAPDTARKAFIENILAERQIQVVWMDE